MHWNVLFCLAAAALLGAGECLLLQQGRAVGLQKFRRRSLRDYKERLIHSMNAETDSDLLYDAGLRLSAPQYNALRLALVLLVAAAGCLKYIQTLVPTTLLWTYAAALGFYLGLAAKKTIFGLKSPFLIFVEYKKTLRQKLYDDELYKAIGQLKNICISQKGNPKGGDYILENLLRYTKATRPIFAQTLSYIRLGELETARLHFTRETGTKLGRDFINILLKLDDIDPAEFVQQLTLFQDAQREKRLTERLNEQESLSLLLYMPAMTNCMIILLNFVMMTMWVSAREGMFI